jgi:hypothetical protein
MQKKHILVPCPKYVAKFAWAELANDKGMIDIPNILISSHNNYYYKRYHALIQNEKATMVKVASIFGTQDVRYLAAIEFHLRYLFYTHLWTAVRVTQKFHYPAKRAIEDFLDQYGITDYEINAQSLYRQWQRIKSRSRKRNEA